MADRLQQWNDEQAHLAKVRKEHPELFQNQTFVEDQASLEPFGIYIPGKEACPLGYTKLWPFDFIVEEQITETEGVTVTAENVLTPETELEVAPTYYATLVKCSVSTIEAVNDLAAQLNCPIEQIKYAGIKDKDALTAQRISIRHVTPEQLKKVTSAYFFLKDVTPGKGILQRGELFGNKFTILIRTDGSIASPEVTDLFLKRLDVIKTQGFYNYYYLQRFGTPRLINYRWGYHIIRGDYKRAVYDVITEPGVRELEYFKKLRAECKPLLGNWKELRKKLEPLPLSFAYELKLIDYLTTRPTDFRGALVAISEQTTLWIYAVASWFFNQRIASYLQMERQLPAELPLLLTSNKTDLEVYRDLLQAYDMWPPPFENLSAFRTIQLRDRTAPVIDKINFHQAEVVKEGIIFSFTLTKGQYATTFLSHLFNLIAGYPPDTINTDQTDIKGVLGDSSTASTIEYFKSVAHSMAESGYGQDEE